MNILSNSKLFSGSQADTGDKKEQIKRMGDGHRERINFLNENRDAIPTDSDYEEAALHMTENTGVVVSSQQAKSILSFYPAAKIDLAINETCVGTEAIDSVIDAVNTYFTGCAPHGFDDLLDGVDWRTYAEHLKKQAQLMGFTLVG